MVDVLQWMKDGKGDNGHGFLMAAQIYNDGRCHQLNCGNVSLTRQVLFLNHVPGQPTSSLEQWCESNVQITASHPEADCTYPDGKDEYYTTCKTIGATLATATQCGACTNPTTAPVPASCNAFTVFDGEA
ncbi:hypothetical protein K470DRAFT_267463 [Piedraia hortae CBS 480.64]|uniref:DUF7492 domain-containing protein n=1 Tax=Piedraia hortae CBS 480.64 TaxID=1314780 RepID=A0A6A7C940_9PEZI|nr:hypothetical protein K470DRAFT_267463 [Piedraia hortae CBS 480.64]